VSDAGIIGLLTLLLMHLLPWAIGTVLIYLVVPLTGPGRRTLCVGLGGAVALPLASSTLWLCDLAGLSLTVSHVLGMLSAISLILFLAAWGVASLRPQTPCASLQEQMAAEYDRAPMARLLTWVLVVLVVWRLATLLPDLLLRPVFPWDAWKLWAWKARVWFESGALVPFLHSSQWLTADAGQFVIDGIDHPNFVPLLMLWSAVGLGMWDDSLIGLSWLMAALFSGLMIHGLLRHLGLPVVMAWLGVYLFFSVPIVATHIALFGYADLWVMVYFLVFAVGLVLWTRQPAWWPVAIMVLGTALMALSKDTGIYWLPVLVLAWLATAIPSRILIVLAAVAGVGAVVVVLFGLDPLAWLTSGRYTLDLQAPIAVMQGMGRHMFVWLDWHLTWYLVPIALFMALLHAGRMPELRTLLVLSMLAIAVAIGGFMVTRAGEYAIRGTLFSRVVLQIYPVLVLMAVVALWRWIRGQRMEEVGDAVADR
jgi:hypothetical protein